MLDGFLANAAAAGVEARGVTGTWPDAAAEVEPADVVVAGHVLYNVPAIEPFARALDAYARRRVVLELTAKHPLDWMRDLWLRFHDLERPVGPTAEDARAVLGESGFAVEREERVVAGERVSGGFGRREDAIHSIRKRLCLPADRDAEIADALGDRLREFDGVWDVGPVERTVVTLWWDPAGRDRRAVIRPTRRRAGNRSTRSRRLVPARRRGAASRPRPPHRPWSGSATFTGRNAPNPPKSWPLIGSTDVWDSVRTMVSVHGSARDGEADAPRSGSARWGSRTQLAEQPRGPGAGDAARVIHLEPETPAPPRGATPAHVQVVVREAPEAPRPTRRARRAARATASRASDDRGRPVDARRERIGVRGDVRAHAGTRQEDGGPRRHLDASTHQRRPRRLT